MISNNRETQLLQRAFRTMMNALARPGLLGDIEPLVRTNEVEEVPLPPCFEMTVRTLVDQAVSFAVSGSKEQQATRWVSLQTHSHPTTLEKANFVLVPDVANSALCRDGILRAFEGTLVEPELGATILLACGAIAGNRIPGDELGPVEPGDKTYRFEVKGPGVQETHVFYADRIDWYEARNERADEYPCGIDIFLVDEEGHIVGIPRTTKFISVEKEGSAWDM